MADTPEQKQVKKALSTLFRNMNKRTVFTDQSYEAINQQADEVCEAIYGLVDRKWDKEAE